MPSVETKIWLALKSRIESVPFSFPKAWPGQTFTPPYSASSPMPYFRIGRVSVDPIRMHLDFGKPHERAGYLIVTLVYPLGSDVSVYDNIVGQVAEHFQDGTQMRYKDICVLVTDYPHVNEGYEDNGYWTVPVSIPWRCFA